ncbi:hypothetical protein GX411_11330 [Candidatus Fermentibacteria bacterium]|nr:hypothetical protein [Candidatus Fermentibacteria bacterium]
MTGERSDRLGFLGISAPALPFLVLLLAVAYLPLRRAFFDPQDFLTFLEPRSAGWDFGRYLAEGWVYYLPDGSLGGFFRPLSSLTFIPEYAAFGADPAGYTAMNVALHLLCCLTAAWLACRMGLSRGASVVAALVLAAHPRAVFAVRMINCRPDVLATMFSLAASGAVLGARGATGRGSAVPAAVLCLMAAWSKELGLVSFPLALLFRLAWPGERAGRPDSARLAVLLAASAALAVASRVLVLDVVAGYSRYSPLPMMPGNALQLLGNVTGTAWIPHAPAGIAAALAAAAFLSVPVAASRDGSARLGIMAAAWILLGSQSILNPGPPHYEYGPCAAMALTAACSADSLMSRRRAEPWAVAAACAALLSPAAVLGRRTNAAYAAATEDQRALFEAVGGVSGEIDPDVRWTILLSPGHLEKMIPWYVHYHQGSEQAVFCYAENAAQAPEGAGLLRYDGRELHVEPPSPEGTP